MDEKLVTFRVRRVPAAVSLSDLAGYLHRSVDGLGGEDNIKARSLASSPDDWTSPPGQTATIEFVKVPERFPVKTEKEWVVPVLNTDGVLLFDISFLGLTPLNAVNKEEHDFDCIAVSGLASHPFGSWRQRNPTSRSQFMWLRDQLPKDFPKMRVMLYGYDTKLTGSESFQSIDDLARSFIPYLKSIGRAEFHAKPWILLAHSLGGILVKRALFYLARSGETRAHMLQKLKTMIFFGVPNRGMQTRHLEAIVKCNPNQDIINSLPIHSSYLNIVDETFSGVMTYQNIRIISAYETMRSPLVVLQPSGGVERTSVKEALLHPDSAIHSNSRNPQDIFHINRDHSNMVKFSHDDLDYFVVRDFIRETVQPLAPRNSNLAADRVNQSASTTSALPISSTSPDELQDLQLPIHATNTLTSARSEEHLIRHANVKELLHSLAFGEQNFRLQAIEKAQEHTFGWIFDKRELDFVNWILSGRRVYWIQSKPGSGKSTLMKYLHDHETFRGMLKSRNMAKSQIDLWFFFNERGTYLQKSLDGFLRSILHQLAKRDNRLADLILKVYSFKPQDTRDQWKIEQMNEAFNAIMIQDGFDIEITLFLDALDEYEGFPEVISRWISELVSMSENSHCRTKLRFCFSSRQWDSLVTAFRNEAGFVLHEHTTHDIRRYVISRLSHQSGAQSLPSENRRGFPFKAPLESVINMIADRAEGVFLWVKLTTDEMAFWPSNANQWELEKLVSKLPAELDDFYSRTIARIPSHSRFRAFALLEIVLRSHELLSPEDLYCAAECAGATTFQECSKLFTRSIVHIERHGVDMSCLSAELLNLCGGLLESVEPPKRLYDNFDARHFFRERPTVIIQFIHRTVRDFVSSPNFPQLILGDQHNLQSENGYSFLLKHRFFSSDVRNPDQKALHLAHYAEITTGRPMKTFVDSIPQSFFDASKSVDITALDWCRSPFIFGVLADLRLYVQLSLQSTEFLRAQLSHARPLNKIAWFASLTYFSGTNRRINFKEMIEVLINHGFRIKEELLDLTAFETLFCGVGDRNSFKPWESQFDEVQVRVAETLVRHGQNVNMRLRYVKFDRGLVSKLYKESSAIHVSHSSMLRMLLDNEADPNVQDIRGNTALDVWISRAPSKDGEVWFSHWIAKQVKMILSHGGRMTRRGAKLLPHFLKAMKREGITLPDSIHKPPLDVPVSTDDIKLPGERPASTWKKSIKETQASISGKARKLFSKTGK